MSFFLFFTSSRVEDYVVSGVVWENFAGEADKTEQWKIGLQKELEKDNND